MGIVDYMSRETNLNMWPESEIYKKFEFTAIDSTHSTHECLNSRLNEKSLLHPNENILEYSRPLKPNRKQVMSSHCCYNNQKDENWTKRDRKENYPGLRRQKVIILTLFKISTKISIGNSSCL